MVDGAPSFWRATREVESTEHHGIVPDNNTVALQIAGMPVYCREKVPLSVGSAYCVPLLMAGKLPRGSLYICHVDHSTYVMRFCTNFIKNETLLMAPSPSPISIMYLIMYLLLSSSVRSQMNP